MKSPFLFINYAIQSNGLIRPSVRFAPILVNGKTLCELPVTFQWLHQFQPTIGHTLTITDGHITAITGNPFMRIPIADRCPCCKAPIDNAASVVKCTNPLCPEKTGQQPTHFNPVTIGTSLGTLGAVRYAALTTGAIVTRTKPGSHTPLLFINASGQLDHTAYLAGFITLITDHAKTQPRK